MSARKTTLIADFDNTLYDWFHMWHQSFRAMLDEIIRISGVPEEVLIPQIRAIHQQYRTSEYAFLIEKIPAVRERFPGVVDIPAIFDSAIHAYRRARKESLALYDGVVSTLQELRARGVLIVLYTESLGFYTNFRVRRLELDELLDFVYSPPDHAIPSYRQPPPYRGLNADDEVLRHAEHRYLPEGVIKPDPAVLLDIVKEIGRKPDECIYVGDSLMKDVAMAQDAGIADVWAKYGGVQHKEEYELLRKVSHWTDEDVERERSLSQRDVKPSLSISRFADILPLFEGEHVNESASGPTVPTA